MTFNAKGGSGTVVAGGGNNRIVIPGDDNGNWSINTGKGDDAILAMGGGSDTINPGGGNNAISLGGGKYVMQSTGDDTVIAGSGAETIAAFGAASDLIFGGASQLYYVGTKGSVTIFGGSGSDTFFGGTGPDVVHGGTGGSNFLVAGTGSATLFGGGERRSAGRVGQARSGIACRGRQRDPQRCLASGPDTLFGGSGAVSILGGANDTFVAGAGSATVDAPLGNNVFVFNDGKAGGSALIQGFASGQDTIDLLGYGKNEVAQALKHQHPWAAAPPSRCPTTPRSPSPACPVCRRRTSAPLRWRCRQWQRAGDHTGSRPWPRRNADDDLSHIRDMPIGHSDH